MDKVKLITNIILLIVGLFIGHIIFPEASRVPISDGDSPQTVRELMQSLAPEYEVVVRRVKQ